ncbi:MAG TPA: IS630 family transposase [Rhizobiales bacterium]|nr:IS630 family transposase [Hyphomicrobiales bacterium]
MQKIDGRKLTAKELLLVRKQAVALRKKGRTYSEIAEALGVHRNRVSEWCRAYEKNGAKALKVGKSGRPKGAGRSLTPAQEEVIQKKIIDKTPDQLKLDFALWTRRAVQQLIKQMFLIDMPVRTVGDYLRRWGFTPQKPLKIAYEQRPAEVKKWLDESYPAITERAKKEGATIHWGDETGMRSDCQHGRSYAPKGQTPAIRLNVKRSSLNMISTVTNQGKVRFMIYEGTMTAQVLIKFLQQLIKGADGKIFLILDNLRVHHSRLVGEWLAQNQEKIEVFFLPAYSPELNPDEYLNCDLKAGVHSGPPARNAKDLKRKVVSHMRKLQKLPNRVASYFRHPKIQYAGQLIMHDCMSPG